MINKTAVPLSMPGYTEGRIITTAKHYRLEEPIHEYFVTVCDWCGKELPDYLDIWCGHEPQPGDVCPYCGKILAEEVIRYS